MRFYYKTAEIWKIADDVRQKYGGDLFPVDPEYIWEISLQKEVRPSRDLGGRGTEAMLHGNFDVIAVDADKYENSSFNYRMRFSIAHEVGHYFLHCQTDKYPKFRSIDDWLNYYENLDDSEYAWAEHHANEFAGRLLVPPDRLVAELRQAWDSLPSHIDRDKIRVPDADEYFAKLVNRKFDVSADVIARRLKRENLWPPDAFGR